MTRRLLLLLLALMTPLAAVRAQPACPAQGCQTGVRGVWITNVDSDVLTTRAKIAEAMDHLVSRGFNTVFPVVYNGGFTLHPSDVMAATFGEARRTHPSFGGRDVLDELIVEGHRVGLEVIPWFEYGFVSSFGGPGHILTAKPQWAALGANGQQVVKNGFYWMDALNPEVQDFMSSLVLEVASRYDVDGIQGDDRMPAMAVEGGYTAVDRALYAADFGGASPPPFPTEQGFVRWKANRLTNYLGRLYRSVKAVDRNLTVSMSPSPFSFGYDEYLQDLPRWLDSAYVDVVHPQLYRYDIASYRFEANKALTFTRPVDLPKFAPGILLKAGSQLNGPAYAVDAVRYNRSRGVSGEVFFFYEGLRARNQFVSDSLRKYVYQTPALVPGRVGRWRPPAPLMTEIPATAGNPAWIEACVAPGLCPTDGLAGSSMRTATAASKARATYRTAVPTGATYDVYAWTPGFSRNRPNATNAARYVLRSRTRTGLALDSAVVSVDQSSTGQTTGWRRIGRIAVPNAADAEVVLDAGGAADGRESFADAVMFVLNRRLSPSSFVSPTAAPRGDQPAPRLAVTVAPSVVGRSGEVRVSVALPAAADVTVRLYDTLGREVGRADAPSASVRADVVVSTRGLAPGLYLVRVTTGADGAAGQARLVVR